MPIAVGLGILVVVGIGIAIFSHPAGASESIGRRGGGGGGTGNGGEDGRKVDEEKKTPPIAVKLPDLSLLKRKATEYEVAPIPTPGKWYRIVEGDMGSAIALAAYDAPKPTGTWLKMALHPYNTTKLGGNYSKWFLPQWAADGSTWVGHFTGLYAVIYVPRMEEI